MHSSVYILSAVKRSMAEMQCSQTVKSFCNAVKWSSSKNDGQDFRLDPGHSCDYGVRTCQWECHPFAAVS